MPPSITAVIVTYQCGERIRVMLQALVAQVAGVVIVDNGSDALTQRVLDEVQTTYPQLEIIRNAENAGLATAQNQGIRRALASGAQHVLLMDDDSVPDAQMVAQMMAANAQKNIGIVAPRYVEQQVEIPSRYLVARGRFWFAREALHAGETSLHALSVIASGSLIARVVFENIGLMADGFFIDYIDHEFCLRARSHGYGILVVGDAILQHSQGEKTRRNLFGMKLVTANYSARRRYTIFRNRLFVVRRYGLRYPLLVPYTLSTCMLDLVRVMFIEPDALAKLGAATKGILHGLTRAVPSAPRA